MVGWPFCVDNVMICCSQWHPALRLPFDAALILAPTCRDKGYAIPVKARDWLERLGIADIGRNAPAQLSDQANLERPCLVHLVRRTLSLRNGVDHARGSAREGMCRTV